MILLEHTFRYLIGIRSLGNGTTYGSHKNNFDIPTGIRAMKKGAVDFLPKPVGDMDLLDAVQEALQKDSQTRTILNERENLQQRLATLTPREHEILTHGVAGLLNKQIAYALNISKKTVKVHLARIIEKMGVDSVAELVRLTEKAGVKPAEVSIL